MTKLRIFYSWQSDLPATSNSGAIRVSLKAAAAKVMGSHAGLNILIDEATRGVPGSPNIAQKVVEKIQQSDIVIADITTVTPKGAPRPCPNPNVSFEAGYAAAEVGWDRVVLLFNTAIGDFENDLPFDHAQNRTGKYAISAVDTKASLKALTALLVDAIEAILETAPKRPAELRGLSPAKIAHDRDVANMRWLMSSLHLPTIDEHIERLPHLIPDRAFWFFEHFRGVVDNSLFDLYDPVLKSAVTRFATGWRAALSRDDMYHANGNASAYIFSSAGDVFNIAQQKEAWAEIEKARVDMAQALQDILARLRQDYLEIDIHETNAKAWADFIAYQTKHADEQVDA